jgi:hypothetical protein
LRSEGRTENDLEDELGGETVGVVRSGSDKSGFVGFSGSLEGRKEDGEGGRDLRGGGEGEGVEKHLVGLDRLREEGEEMGGAFVALNKPKSATRS